jgi:hypothetical protein
MGKMRSSMEVLKQKICWAQNSPNRTPESTKRVILLPLPQDQRTPPKFIAIMMQRAVPQERIEPM